MPETNQFASPGEALDFLASLPLDSNADEDIISDEKLDHAYAALLQIEYVLGAHRSAHDAGYENPPEGPDGCPCTVCVAARAAAKRAIAMQPSS